jgi:hypothetical protein
VIEGRTTLEEVLVHCPQAAGGDAEAGVK